MRRASLAALQAAVMLLMTHDALAADHESVMCALPKVAQKCPIWTQTGYKHQGEDGAPLDGKDGKADMPFDPVLSQQDVPCTAHSATCFSEQGYHCDYSKGMYHMKDMDKDKWYELKPGSPAVCAHGNREFSFLASKREDDKKLVVFLAAGGICWDAKTCGDPQARQVALDALHDLVPKPGTGPARELAPAVPRALKDGPLSNSGQAEFEQGLLKRSESNDFGSWSAVVVPDCTGDLHLGNHSYTYDEGLKTCITAHHMGGVNTGEAIKWVLDNFLPSDPPSHILVVGSAPRSFKAVGGHGAGFWATYLAEMYPTTIVRTVVDASLGINGPRFPDMLRDDPWGTLGARIPNWDHYPVDETDPEGLLRDAPNGGYLMPPPELYNIVEDSVTDSLRLMEKHYPTLAFAEVTTTEDTVQKLWYETTGGKEHDCCLDGCGCNARQPHGVRGGRLDWTKARKVAVLQRQLRLPNSYRSWIHDSAHHFLLLDEAAYSQTTLHTWLSEFARSTITLENKINVDTKRTQTEVTTTLPHSDTCDGCLDGVLGATAGAEQCNMTWGEGENFYTVAAKFQTDWMALWSLNGGDAPDVAKVSTQYRFAHEYHVRPGETLETIAMRFGTSVEHLLMLNMNLITHVHNPRLQWVDPSFVSLAIGRVAPGDVICLAPSFHGTKDQMGLPICPSDRQKFGQSDADAASSESGSLEAAAPLPESAHMASASDSAHAAAAHTNGEAACEGHGYTEDECLAIGNGCCQWSPDTIPSQYGMPAAPGSGGRGACWSDVGDDPCVA